MRMIDEDEVGLKEKPEDTRYIKNKATRSPEISRRTGSETNTTIFVIYIYILDIDSHCPYLLSGETTFQLTSCSNSLHVYLRFGETTSPI